MTDAGADLFDILTWMSPAWPIGAFAHSGGLEWAVEDGLVTDRTTACDWLLALLEHGPLRNDAALFAYAWRAADAGDGEALREIAELAVATQTGRERRIEATAQGAAFRKIALATLDPPPPAEMAARSSPRYQDALPLHHPSGGPPPPVGEDLRSLLAPIDNDDLAYPIAAATLFASRGIPLATALTAWLHGAVANLVSAAQRLVPLGQTDGQLLLAQLRPAVLDQVAAALALPEDGDPFDALGGAALVAELGCMAHETQYTRLFRT